MEFYIAWTVHTVTLFHIAIIVSGVMFFSAFLADKLYKCLSSVWYITGCNIFVYKSKQNHMKLLSSINLGTLIPGLFLN